MTQQIEVLDALPGIGEELHKGEQNVNKPKLTHNTKIH